MMIRLTLILLLLVGCSDSTDPAGTATDQQQAISRTIFATSVTQFEVKVFYEAGATPYTGTIPASLGDDTWDITRKSYEALFQNHSGRTVNAPSTVGGMTALPDQAKTVWTSNDLVILAQTHAPTYSSGTAITMSVFFLNGTFEGSGDILGVHITGYPYAFVFKDVVAGAGATTKDRIYVEQATVVHEVGHAIGLVNGGVPMVTNHEDAAHPHHSTNSNCVMYWAVESQSNIISTITGFITGNDLDLFGAQSLQDGRAYQP